MSLDERARELERASRRSFRHDVVAALRDMVARPAMRTGANGCPRCRTGFVFAEGDGALCCVNCGHRTWPARASALAGLALPGTA